MIIADTNLIAYLLVAGPFSKDAQRVWDRDPRWLSPTIWHFELLNVLATSVRERLISSEKALYAWAHAPAFVEDAEVPPLKVLRLATTLRIATYDCYYVVLAQELNARLVTADKKLLREFSDTAISIEDFASGK